MAFDGIVTKVIATELQEVVGARIDKIYEPNKNDVLIGMYINGVNYALNICTDSQNYRVHLTTHIKPNPQNAPNFCMVLRKHLIGLRIKNIIATNLERVITIEFEGFDDVDDIITKKLIIELMGRHCNIILLDENNIIIDSLRHIVSDNLLTRDIIPKVKYKYPETTKKNLLQISNFEEFENELQIDYDQITKEKLPIIISNIFNGISKQFITNILNELEIEKINKDNMKKIYVYITDIINNTDSLNLNVKVIEKSSGVKRDYFLTKESSDKPFNLNYVIDDYYFDKENTEVFKNYKNNISKLILATLKKYKKRLYNINEKLEECNKMEKYKLYGELITANLYKIKIENADKIKLENYYENNQIIEIPLDKKYVPSRNAKIYFKKYNKLKNALSIVGQQKEETLKELEYIESVIYELEECKTIDDLINVFDEISENNIFKEKPKKVNQKNKVKKSKLTKDKKKQFNPIKYTINGYTLLVGRNNIENDYLTLKYAQKTDLWFHTKDIHGSHCILLLNKSKIPNDNIIVRCAQIAAFHSKGRNSSNVPVDVCEVKYVKKPNGSKPGFVIYKNNRTYSVNPRE
ncbi:MAG: NFACT family protein [Clostridia bacterium]